MLAAGHVLCSCPGMKRAQIQGQTGLSSKQGLHCSRYTRQGVLQEPLWQAEIFTTDCKHRNIGSATGTHLSWGAA